MTKKAAKLLNKFEERTLNHVEFYKRHKEETSLTYKWTCDYLTEMYNDFKNMILSLYRFDQLSEKDMTEMLKLINNIYNSRVDKLMSYR